MPRNGVWICRIEHMGPHYRDQLPAIPPGVESAVMKRMSFVGDMGWVHEGWFCVGWIMKTPA